METTENNSRVKHKNSKQTLIEYVIFGYATMQSQTLCGNKVKRDNEIIGSQGSKPEHLS